MFIVFDLDDTLADTSHRQHILDNGDKASSETWNKFFDACDKDTPNTEIIEVCDVLSNPRLGHRVEIWTGRSDRVFEKTNIWLRQHLLHVDNCILRMRVEGDFRHDTEIKGEWIQRFGKPDLVFEDRNSMVKYFREQGITVCQVKESDY